MTFVADFRIINCFCRNSFELDIYFRLEKEALKSGRFYIASKYCHKSTVAEFWVLLFCSQQTLVKTVGCVISCCVSARIYCSSFFTLTLSVISVQTCLPDYTKYQFPLWLCDASDEKSHLFSLDESKCSHLFHSFSLLWILLRESLNVTNK